MTPTIRVALAALAVVALAGSLAACAGGPDGTSPVETNAEAPEGILEILEDALQGPDAEGDDGRAFGASDDIVILAVEKTFSRKNASASWEGSTLTVAMDGSIEDPIASIPCTALEGLLADGESAVIVYSDGDLICADR